MTAAEVTGIVVAAAGVAAGMIKVLDKLIELVQVKRGPDYNFQLDAWRREILEAIRENTNVAHQLRLELRESSHRVLSALGVPRSRHELPDDPQGFETGEGGQ